MISDRHPLIGQEYEVVDPDQFPVGTGEPDTVVPTGYDDTGNLRVDQYYQTDSRNDSEGSAEISSGNSDDQSESDGRTVLWNEDGFVELVQEGVIDEH